MGNGEEGTLVGTRDGALEGCDGEGVGSGVGAIEGGKVGVGLGRVG